MLESHKPVLPAVERSLRRFKRPLYAAILSLVAVQSLVANRLVGTPVEDYARYTVAALALVGAVLMLLAPRLFRVLEVGVLLVGAATSLGFLRLALAGDFISYPGAIRSFTIWLALLIVWAFLAFRSKLALGVSALLLVLGVARVAVHLFVANPLPAGERELGALLDLVLVGVSYLLLLFGLTNSIERRSAALATEETAARILALDSLTGLTNRAAFHRTHQQLTRGRADKHVTLVLVDLDDFRSINERFGTAAGDEILRESALRLANTVGQDAHVLARLGGDVFGLLIEEHFDEHSSAALAGRVNSAFQPPFSVGGGPLQVTVTLGFSRYPLDAATQTEQMSLAESAVARAKERGEGYRLASEGTHEQERSALARDLREALGKGELELYFQPIGTVLAGLNPEAGGTQVAVRTVESLLRWNHPERGVIQPQEFVPLAERAGLIVSIGNWVLAEACRQAMRWEQDGHGAFNVSVNVSPHQFTEPGLVASVRRALLASGLAPERLLVEVTETSAIQPVVEKRLAEIRALGVRVAIDDFGSGYSSLGRLRYMPIDFVKLDRSFVKGLGGNDMRARLVVRAAVVLAHGLGAKVVAEGIESEEQAVAAVGVGCDYLQGFLLDPPAPAGPFGRAWQSGDLVTWTEFEHDYGSAPVN
ncbi:MAG: bifunctional diguanylate cyclase/phosphodiesterase [Trueperaceae bacterium]